MRTTILLLAALCLSAAAAAQRPDRRGPPDPEARFTRLSETLHLSSEQQSKVRAILDAAHEAHERVRAGSQVDREQLRSQTNSALAEVLSAEQMQQLEMLQAQRPRPPNDQRRPPNQ